MQFLTLDDIKTLMFSVFITESQNEFGDVLDKIEEKKIAIVRSKIGVRYDCDVIFAKTGNERSKLIIDALAHLVVYDLVRRNSARKVPEDFRLDWEYWNKWMDAVRDGREAPPELPAIDLSTGNNISTVYFGNNSNRDFYS